MNENVLDAAIECRLPMFWTVLPSWYDKRLELRVVTALFETGTVRSRRIHRCAGLEEAFQISVRVYERAGRLDCTQLLKSDLDIWALGWRPELGDLLGQVRKLFFERRHINQQALWDEFAKMVRR
jgi:hypothetical protein